MARIYEFRPRGQGDLHKKPVESSRLDDDWDTPPKMGCAGAGLIFGALVAVLLALAFLGFVLNLLGNLLGGV